MKNRPSLEIESAILVNKAAILVFFISGLAAAFFQAGVFAAVLLFMALLGLLSRLWAAAASRRVKFALTSDVTRVFPGETITLKYTVTNDKLLPLVWLELFQPLDETLCLAPAEAGELRRPTEKETVSLQDKESSLEYVAEKSFSLLLWHQTLSWASRWEARRRGVYQPRHLHLRTGDGFGLTQLGWGLDKTACPVFVVYPAIVPVRVELFLRDLWEAQTGASGYVDDVTVIRSTRAYQTADSIKRINWRMAARLQPLSVNIYETILPKSAHFILDSESFNGVTARQAELEETLSVLASLLLRLNEAQVRCGLSVPRFRGASPVNLFAGDGAAVEDMLFQLAACRFCVLVTPEGEQQPRVPPPVFAEEELFSQANEVGRYYYLAYELGSLPGRHFLRRVDPASVTVIVYCEPDQERSAALSGFEIISLTELKGGGRHA